MEISTPVAASCFNFAPLKGGMRTVDIEDIVKEKSYFKIWKLENFKQKKQQNIWQRARETV